MVIKNKKNQEEETWDKRENRDSVRSSGIVLQSDDALRNMEQERMRGGECDHPQYLKILRNTRRVI